MPLNLPNGSGTADVNDPDGRAIGEIVRTDTGETVWSGFTNYFLDMQDAGDNVDLSANTVTMGEGQTFLTWIKVYQLGSSSAAHYPGIFSNASGGDWDDFIEFYSDAGSGAITSGTADARFAGETASGSWVNTNTFTIDLDNPTWHLVGMSYLTDGSITFWYDGSEITTNANNAGTGESWNVNYIGYAYAGENDGGSGGKDIDEFAIWDRVLTSTEVSDYYSNGTMPDTPLHHWNFNNADDTTTATDVAGSSDGTVNSATFVQGGPSVIGDTGGDGGGTSGYYLDMTATDDHIDVSSHSIAVSPGQSFLAWVDFDSVGQGTVYYPGVFSTSSTGSYDNFLSFRDDDSTGGTSTGTVNVNMYCEAADGNYGSSDAFSVDLDNTDWHLIGFTYHSDGTQTWWHNGGSITTRGALNASSQFDISYIGYSYGDSTDDGSGGKSMDGITVFDYEITSSDVSDWYNNGNVPSSPLHAWHLDDNSDTTTAVDSAGTADGTINGSSYVEGGQT